MSSLAANVLPTEFRNVGFLSPSVQIENPEPGVLLLRSERRLRPHPKSTLDWLRYWVERRPEQAILVERDRAGAWQSVSYAQAWAAVRSIATVLLARGASRARPLLILSENSMAQALLTWGALYAGVPVGLVSPAYSLLSGNFARVKAAAAVVTPWIVFAQDAQRFSGALAALEVPDERLLVVDNARAGMMRFADWVAATPSDAIDEWHATLAADLPAKYMFTSGSTGMPKAVVITRAMLAAAQEMAAQVFERDPVNPPVYLEWLPWHHVMGGNIVQNRVLRFGGTLYLDEGKPVPGSFDATLRNLRDVAPSLYFNVPAGLTMLVAALEADADFARHFFSKLAYVYYGGAVLARDIYERFQAVAVRTTGQRIVLTSVFGATETSGPAVTQHWAVDDVGCIGLPLPGVELKLVEDSSLPGRYEMRVRGPNVFREYLNAPELTRAAFDADGYYRLGDAVRFVDPGHPKAGLRFAGRFAEDFKIANGTWVRTAALRAHVLDACGPLLKEAVITHDGGNAVGALAWVDRAGCLDALPELAATAAEALVKHPVLLSELERRLRTASQLADGGQRGASMRIERLALLAEPPSMQAYEITDKGSINQRAVIERRTADIAALFACPCPAHVVAVAGAVVAERGDAAG